MQTNSTLFYGCDRAVDRASAICVWSRPKFLGIEFLADLGLAGLSEAAVGLCVEWAEAFSECPELWLGWLWWLWCVEWVEPATELLSSCGFGELSVTIGSTCSTAKDMAVSHQSVSYSAATWRRFSSSSEIRWDRRSISIKFRGRSLRASSLLRSNSLSSRPMPYSCWTFSSSCWASPNFCLLRRSSSLSRSSFTKAFVPRSEVASRNESSSTGIKLKGTPSSINTAEISSCCSPKSNVSRGFLGRASSWPQMSTLASDTCL